MTNAQNYQAEIVKKSEAGELNSYESEFAQKIESYSKKELNNLTKPQFMLLRKIAEA